MISFFWENAINCMTVDPNEEEQKEVMLPKIMNNTFMIWMSQSPVEKKSRFVIILQTLQAFCHFWLKMMVAFAKTTQFLLSALALPWYLHHAQCCQICKMYVSLLDNKDKGKQTAKKILKHVQFQTTIFSFVDALFTSNVYCAPSVVTCMNQQYAVTVTHGEAKTLQSPCSDVSLDIPQGSKGIFLMKVSTDFTRHHIPENECIISPLVEVHHFKDMELSCSTSLIHTLKIQHCLPDKEHRGLVRVKKGRYNTPKPHEPLQEKKPQDPDTGIFWLDKDFITIQTRSFSDFICTICKNICHGAIKVFLFGNSAPLWDSKKEATSLKMKTYLCSPLYKIPTYRQVGKAS